MSWNFLLELPNLSVHFALEIKITLKDQPYTFSEMKSSEIKIVDNLLDSQTISELIDSVDKHFEQNLMFSDFIDVTNSLLIVMDLLYLIRQSSLILRVLEYICLKVKQNVDNYCKTWDRSNCSYTIFLLGREVFTF